MMLRNHIIDVFEHADLAEGPRTREGMLTFVVAGGGFAGVETVAELKDFALAAQGFYRNVLPQEVRVLLVHSGARILPEIGESLADYALKHERRVALICLSEETHRDGVEQLCKTQIVCDFNNLDALRPAPVSRERRTCRGHKHSGWYPAQDV